MSTSFRYESNENIVITCSTKVCSFGKQVVEKVETEYSRLESSRFIYRIQRSPMCEYMINFIQKLKGLPERYMMNSVLENFTILQVRKCSFYSELIMSIDAFKAVEITFDLIPSSRSCQIERPMKRYSALHSYLKWRIRIVALNITYIDW